MTIEELKERLNAELESEIGGHDHIWSDVRCPTCGASRGTHCAGDPAERPKFDREGVYDRNGETVYPDQPCAKRVIAAVLKLTRDNDG